jgi:[CysO sulfur-carrier protein]-thiocarboxylate-dependent cysteine synthase
VSDAPTGAMGRTSASPRSATRFADVRELVGNTPHLRVRCAEQPGLELYVKLEGHNPTGSIKDRAGVQLIADRLEAGELRPGMTLLDASSGNMGCAIAYFGRLAGYAATVVSSSKLTADKRGFMRYFGAAVEQVGDFTIEGNRRCREMAAAEPGRYCFLDQLHASGNPRAHYLTTGPEILAAFPDLAMLVGSLGSGGSLLGTAQFLKERRPGLLVVAVEAASGTRLPGTGAFDDGDYVTPFIRQGYERGTFDERRKVEYGRAAARALELRDQGIFAGLQTGGVYEAAVTAAGDHGVRGEVVILSGDTGWKNMEKLLALES